MERIARALNELQQINNVYSLSNDAIEKLVQEAENAKVCTPIIGKFSSGKSALLNTVLGYSKKILKEDITPETAVPTEISYDVEEDSIYVVGNDGVCKRVSVSEYKELDVDANTVCCTRLNLRNSFLEEIPDVMLVDMPGFDSGFEVHNKAIDNYLPRSLAYIIAFPADDMIVRSSVGNILKELCLHDMPICIAITKYDKRNDEFDDTFEALKESLKRFIGDRTVTYCITSSYSGDAEELEDFLRGIQEQSQEILANKFRNAVLSVADTTENYLRATLKSSELSESELDEQEEKLGKQMNSLNNRFSKEKEAFDSQVSECIEGIKADVQMALEAEESSFVAMIMNKQNINERMNSVVRNAVTISTKKRFLPNVEKYLKRVADCIKVDVGDVLISFNFSTENVGRNIISAVVATTAASVALVVAGPIFGSIIAGLIASFMNKVAGEKKREETKQQIRMQLNSDIYPQVIAEVGTEIEIAIMKQIDQINTSIEDEIMKQRATLEKAMGDVRKKLADEKEQKKNMAVDINAALERIQIIRSEI